MYALVLWSVRMHMYRYFDESDDEYVPSSAALWKLPHLATDSSAVPDASDSEDDPLDAFMAGIKVKNTCVCVCVCVCA